VYSYKQHQHSSSSADYLSWHAHASIGVSSAKQRRQQQVVMLLLLISG
jgi:hypothetical protein